MAEKQTNDTAQSNNHVASPLPQWLEASHFEKVLSKSVTGFKKIINFKAYPAMAAGENYATIMLRVEIEVQLEDNNTKTIPYMLKAPHETETFKAMKKMFDIFAVESTVYIDVVPELEQLYRDAGVEVKFGAQCHQLETEHDNILLEDLRPRGFKNANRLEGLDMEHTKCVLKKLAQWHAASAKRVETKGNYPDLLVSGVFKEENRVFMQTMNEGLNRPFVKCMKRYEGSENYLEAVEKLVPTITDQVLHLGKVDPNEFNVLNHGDCWSNNVMFQYDAFGKIKETYFVDFQVAKYGTPAQDLLYFLLSSTQLELKLKQFEYFIKFYHDCLVDHLNLLKYSKKLPTLKDMHMMLYKYGIWGYCTVSGVMAAVLLDPTEQASFDNFLGDSDAGTQFKMLMYSNARYRKHAEAILPWLQNRGALEC